MFDINIFYQDTGAGLPFVLIHGLSDSSAQGDSYLRF